MPQKNIFVVVSMFVQTLYTFINAKIKRNNGEFITFYKFLLIIFCILPIQ